MKLTKRKLRCLIRWKEAGMSSSDVAWYLKISKRRVNQVWRMYKESGEIPEIGRNIGRPRRELTEDEKRIILEAKSIYKLGARRLEPIIERDYGIHIPHNKIHEFLLAEGLAKEEPNKKKRRRWIRYEWKYSLSAAHMDWHDGIDNKKVCIIQDDASRKILVGDEFDHGYESNSIALFKRLVNEYWHICPLGVLIIDHGSQFGAHRMDENGQWESEFKTTVEGYNTKVVCASVNHPQTNGKVERIFYTYDKYRSEFNSFLEFVDWYNCIRPHESLGTKYCPLETPENAFWRKLPPDAILGLLFKNNWRW